MLAPFDLDELTVRPVRPGDCEGLIALFNAKEGQVAPIPFKRLHHIPAAIRAKLEGESPDDFRLVALDHDEIIAQAGLIVKRPLGTLTIYVRHDFRRCGIGSKLIERLVEDGEMRLELGSIETEVFADNLPAIALYEKFGFERQTQRIDQNDRLIFVLMKAIKGMNQRAVGRM